MTSAPSAPTTARLTGRTAVVTGSTSGIGAAVAHALAAEGASVVVSGRDAARGGAVVGEIIAAGGRAVLVPADLADADLDAMLAVDVRAPHVLVGELVPAMAERGSGVVVTVGSWMAVVGTPMTAMYTATEAADAQLTRSWAAGFGPRGVRVNTVAPGVTLTPGNASARPVLDAMTAATPAGVVVRPEDVARGVVHLASDDAATVHGTTLHVDGGITATRPG